MAITFPRTNLHTLTNLEPAFFTLPPRQKFSRTAAGETLAKDIGPALWRGEFRSVPLEEAPARALMAWLNSLSGGIGTFTAYDARFPFPVSNPGGATALNGVQINSLSNGAISLKGLPAGFVLTVGDRLAFDWGTGRRAYHEVVEGATANGSGVTPVFEVRPHVRAGAAVDAAVTLNQPRAVFRLDAGSLAVSTVGFLYTQFTWTATQRP